MLERCRIFIPVTKVTRGKTGLYVPGRILKDKDADVLDADDGQEELDVDGDDEVLSRVLGSML
jgi:hypothetical protein